MGQVDFGKIISAAAVSTLGVLSLIIVALGVIAFFFFKGSPEKVKLSVWWTMVLAGGLFAAAVVKQTEPERPRPVPDPTDTPKPIDTPKPTPTETPDPAPSATPSASPSPVKPTPLVTRSPSEPDSDDLSGQWHDAGGYTYLITHSGSAITIQQWLNGMAIGYGQGMLNGRDLRYNFVAADGNQGGCNGTVAEDGKRITGMCTSGRGTLPFTVER